MEKHEVAIIGAGIGGLACAIALVLRGIDVRVYEKAVNLEEVGAGIQLSANACHVLQSIGVLDALIEQAVMPKRAHFKHFKSGESLFKAPLGLIHRLAFGERYLHVHRADLQQALIARLAELSPRALQLGRSLAEVSHAEDGVSFLFDDGSRGQASCLIGADGIRSKVRSLLFDDAAAEWTGNFAWRALLPVHQLPANFMAKQATIYVGPKQHLVMYYLRQCRWLNIVAVQETDVPMTESWVQKIPYSSIADAFDGWHPDVQMVIKHLPRDDLYRWDLFRRPEMSTWVHGQVALLGDSAHATLPFIAQGAAMALEDALVLARCLSEYGVTESSLKRYEGLRKTRTGEMQRRADANGDLYHQDEQFIKKAFSEAMSDANNYRFMSNIYRYKAAKVKLN